MNELALFAGSGGGILGGMLLGWRTVAAVEIEDYPRRVLLQRQADGILPRFPIWDDVRTFDGKPWRGKVDVISGGFPCQDISAAGKGAGIDGARSGMWSQMARIVGEVRPRFAFVENSPLLVGRGLARVIGDLAQMGYNARWGIVGAHHAGAPHKRDRIWILANASKLLGDGCNDHGKYGKSCPIPESGNSCGKEDAMADANSAQCEGVQCAIGVRTQHSDSSGSSWWKSEPDVGRVAHGVASRVDRLKAIGNGQVPAVAALAWAMLGDTDE